LALEDAAKLRRENALKEAELQGEAEALRHAFCKLRFSNAGALPASKARRTSETKPSPVAPLMAEKIRAY
jgi:hypothetical protein